MRTDKGAESISSGTRRERSKEGERREVGEEVAEEEESEEGERIAFRVASAESKAREGTCGGWGGTRRNLSADKAEK